MIIVRLEDTQYEDTFRYPDNLWVGNVSFREILKTNPGSRITVQMADGTKYHYEWKANDDTSRD
jgi:hypothetical protein